MEDDMPALIVEGATSTSTETHPPDTIAEKKSRKRLRNRDSQSAENMEVDGPSSRKNQKVEVRRVGVPANRYTPLKENWMKIYTPIVEHLDLQIRFNLSTRNVEIRSGEKDVEPAYLQKAEDFVRAFVYGFDVEDALALIRLEDLFIDTFQVTDVKMLKGDHLSRAIGRIAGKGGRTKFSIENATRTRIVLADSKAHILGSYQNIQLAKRALSNLILGAPPSKIYGTLRTLSSRSADQF